MNLLCQKYLILIRYKKNHINLKKKKLRKAKSLNLVKGGKQEDKALNKRKLQNK